MFACSALGVCLVLLAAPAHPGKQESTPQRPARHDQQGDPLPEGAIARIGTVRLRHAGPVTALAYSHDGKILASGSEDGTIRLWDAATGKELQCLAKQQGKVAQVHFSADGRRLIAWSDWLGYFSRVRVWDLQTGKAIGASGGLARHPEAIAVSHDGTRVATVEGDTPRQHYGAAPAETSTEEEGPPRNLEVWDTRTGKRLLRLKLKEKEPVEALSLSPDGKWLAVAERKITVRETVSGKECSSFFGGSFPRALAFTQDGKSLAVLEWSQIRYWDPATGEERKAKAFPDKLDYDIPIPPWDRGLLMRPRGGGLKRIDDFADRKWRCQFRDPDAWEHVFAFSPDGKRLATGGKDHCIRIRDTASGKEVLSFVTPHGTLFLVPCHDPRVAPLLSDPGCCNLLRDGKTLAVSVAGAIVHFDAASGRERRRDKLPRAKKTPDDLEIFHPRSELYALDRDGRQAIVSDGRDILLLDLASGKSRRVFDEKDEIDVNVSEFSPDGTRVALWGQQRVFGGLVFPPPVNSRLVDVRSGKKIRICDGILDFFDRALFSPDGRWLAVKGMYNENQKDKAWLVDLATGKAVSRPPREAVNGANLTFSPSGSLFASWHDPVIAPPPWARVLPWARELSEEESLSPESQRVKVWDLATGTLVTELPDPGCTTTSVVLASNGWLLAAGKLNGDIVLWNLASGKEVRRLRGHRGPVNTLSFSGDRRLLVSGSSDVTVLTWDVSDLAASGLSPRAKLTPAKRDALWQRLAVPDAAKAYPSLWQFVGADKVVPFFRERLRPVAAVPEERVTRLIADLQEKQFAVRSRAFKELDRLDHLAEPVVRKALAGRPSLEGRRRMELLLDEWREPTRSPERLQALRALLVLESIGNAEAMKLLRELAGGAPEAWFTQQARASLERLGRLRSTKP
jgi:WD40 repeat protein